MYHNGAKQTMDSGEREYQALLKSKLAQQQDNAFIDGVQEVYKEGAGKSIKGSVGHYGAPRIMPQQVLEGEFSNFQQRDTPGNVGNAAVSDMLNSTGNADAQTSSTIMANKDPQEFQTDALDRRLAVISGALGQSEANLNNHQQVYRA